MARGVRVCAARSETAFRGDESTRRRLPRCLETRAGAVSAHRDQESHLQSRRRRRRAAERVDVAARRADLSPRRRRHGRADGGVRDRDRAPFLSRVRRLHDATALWDLAATQSARQTRVPRRHSGHGLARPRGRVRARGVSLSPRRMEPIAEARCGYRDLHRRRRACGLSPARACSCVCSRRRRPPAVF